MLLFIKMSWTSIAKAKFEHEHILTENIKALQKDCLQFQFVAYKT